MTTSERLVRIRDKKLLRRIEEFRLSVVAETGVELNFTQAVCAVLRKGFDAVDIPKPRKGVR